ncbi:Hypothetical predicted protein, partial [Paramuricea clavata]
MKDFKRIFWIDSTTVLSWVRTPPRQFKPFVSSRVAEIQETIGTEDFRYVRSKSNPADGLTRGIEPAELANWLVGPSFLKFPEAQWPEFHEDLRLSNSVFQETMKEKKSSFSSNCNKEVNEVNVCLATEEKKENPILCHLMAACSSFSKHLHDKRRHCGYKSLMHEARKRFWIIGLRSMCKQLTRRCIICRKLRKKPLDQLMGQIPSLRLAAGLPPFSNTAMDMFGPVQIRMNRKTLKEAQVIIFACMTTRAVHLELVTDKSTETFLLAFRRFACLRGHPNVCWSDCESRVHQNIRMAFGRVHQIVDFWKCWLKDNVQKTTREELDADYIFNFANGFVSPGEHPQMRYLNCCERERMQTFSTMQRIHGREGEYPSFMTIGILTQNELDVLTTN